MELWPVMLLTASVTLGSVLSLWLISIAIRDISIIDMAFSALITLLIASAWYFTGEPGGIAWLTLVLVMIWATRMTVYLVKRNWGHGEDPRYTRLRSWVPEGLPFYWLSLRQVFLLQGVVIWILTLPQQIMMASGNDVAVNTAALFGVAVWIVGFLFETVGDYQLTKFKSDPGNKGQIMNRGLWRYTRHPNYFGELCQWWGLFIIALQAPWAWMGIIGPLVYSWLVINVTGQRTLDKKMQREKPEYADYMARTNGLLPWFPKA